MWRWFSINIDDDTHFGGILIGTDAGDLHRGWVWRDGERTSRSRSGRSRASSPTTASPTRPRHVIATDKAGRAPRARRRGAPRRAGPAGIRPSTTIVNEGLARWTYEGRTGNGISEYLHQLDAEARPVVPIA